jgi:hypothetical protein
MDTCPLMPALFAAPPIKLKLLIAAVTMNAPRWAVTRFINL